MIMIQYYSATVPLKQDIFRQAIDLIAATFGEAEASIERQQLAGCDAADNQDHLFWAQKDGALIGMLLLTIPKQMSKIGALSGFCVSGQNRGYGIGKVLLSNALTYFDQCCGEVLFLGTDNPVASHLYRQFGFAFASGSHIMYRSRDDSLLPFFREYYTPDNIKIKPATAAMRIQLIPLILQHGRDNLMDANAGIISTAVLTQRSCMGLYPRYAVLIENGGSVFCGYNEKGMLCAVASLMITGTGDACVDAFCAPGCESIMPELLSNACRHTGGYYAHLADSDILKSQVFSEYGFRRSKAVTVTWNDVLIPCHQWCFTLFGAGQPDMKTDRNLSHK